MQPRKGNKIFFRRTYTLEQSTFKRLLWLIGGLLALWAAIEYLLPVALPFLLGWLLALGAEPLVRLAGTRLKLPRPIASGMGVSLTLVLFGTVVFFLGAFLFLIVSYLPGCHMGGGDIKLAALLGILARPKGILTISFVSAAYALLYLQLWCKKPQQAIPFAPFFLLGTLTQFIIWR